MHDQGRSYEQLSLMPQENMASNKSHNREAKDRNKPNAYTGSSHTQRAAVKNV